MCSIWDVAPFGGLSSEPVPGTSTIYPSSAPACGPVAALLGMARSSGCKKEFGVLGSSCPCSQDPRIPS